MALPIPPNRPLAPLLSVEIVEGETFGSWFRRLAATHGIPREEMAAGLDPYRDHTEELARLDWDATPPGWLIAQLLLRSPEGNAFPWVRFNRALPALSPEHRGVYCPTCWAEDRERGLVAQRHGWLDPWCVLCGKHGVPLTLIAPSFEDTLWAHALLALAPNRSRVPARVARQARGLLTLPPIRLDAWTPCRDVPWMRSRAPLILREPSRMATRYNKDDIRRDLVLMVGCDVDGLSMLEWVLPAARRWTWFDSAGAPLDPEVIDQPVGDLRLRQEAMRMGAELWR